MVSTTDGIAQYALIPLGHVAVDHGALQNAGTQNGGEKGAELGMDRKKSLRAPRPCLKKLVRGHKQTKRLSLGRPTFDP